jgi:hypothetical protein
MSDIKKYQPPTICDQVDEILRLEQRRRYREVDERKAYLYKLLSRLTDGWVVTLPTRSIDVYLVPNQNGDGGTVRVLHRPKYACDGEELDRKILTGEIEL